jgi:putative FmdB family regulatory protein
MPVHEYECDVCGKRFSVRRSFGDPQPTTCPDGHEGVHRVFSPPTIIFKGSGFYVTDNRSSNRASRSRAKDTTKTEKTEKETPEKTKTGEES